MMRLALFEVAGATCSLALNKVLHVLTAPQVFRLPLLRRSFVGGILYREQIVPLLAAVITDCKDRKINQKPPFVLVCEAEYGLVAVPADKIIRITKTGELDSKISARDDSQIKMYEISGRDYRLLNLNRVLEDPAFTVCGLKN